MHLFTLFWSRCLTFDLDKFTAICHLRHHFVTQSNTICWIDINMMSTIEVNWPSNMGQKEHLCNINCQHQIDVNSWHQIVVTHWYETNFSSNNSFSPSVFASGHFLDTFLTSYWPHVLMSIWYLQFDISRMSKSDHLNFCHVITLTKCWHHFEGWLRPG